MEAGRRWHQVPLDEALAELGTTREGLAEEEAARRLSRHGPNRLPEPPRPGVLLRFLRQFADLLIQVLLGAALVTAVLGHWVDTAVILAVVVANAVIGFVQEGKAEAALRAIRDMLAPAATVLRDGRRRSVPGETLVPGDLVLLEPGDRVPADLRLVEVRGLRVQEAVLTGESVAVEKGTEPVAADAALGDRASLAFSGTLVTAGLGRGVAVATGAETELGRISGMLAEVEAGETPLVRQMAQFSRWLTGFVLAAAAAILAFGTFLGGQDFESLFMAVVGLSVAAIPEGLPAILTVTLAIGVQGMARRNAIVRRLPAIETLGAVSVICSDKTGTLTRNEMMVATVATAARTFRVDGEGYAPRGAFLADGEEIAPDAPPLLSELARSAVLCSEAELAEARGEWHVVGDPMEGALVALSMKAGVDATWLRSAHREVDAIPFDAAHRFMASLRHDHEGNAAVYVKGAPERVVTMCDRSRTEDGGDGPVDHEAWQRRMEEIAAEGQRVLAIAVRPVDADRTRLEFADVEQGLVLLGLVGLIDPPREEAVAAVADCRAAGIRVKMITGDHGATARAIARQLGLENDRDVLTGADLDHLDEGALAERAATVDVFARTSPEHKLRLVTALQARGAVVAMTGDGVNDAPALKRADVGIAMGRKGTEAAKEASEIVLADDDFATLAAAVAAGRTVYDNLKKAIVFLLPVNGGESLSLVAALLLGLTLPISPLQILWVNMVSSVVLAMTLAFEAAEPGVMRRRPRPPSEPILSGFVLWRVAFVSALFSLGIFGKFALAKAQGADLETARTIAVNTLVVMEIFYLFAVRYLHVPSLTLRGALGTKPVLLAVAAVTVLQFLFTYAPFMETFFQTRPLTLAQGLQTVAVGVAVLLVLEVEKRLVRARELRAERAAATGPGKAAESRG
jgi:magnesium-transporting ATPase (P-type)